MKTVPAFRSNFASAWLVRLLPAGLLAISPLALAQQIEGEAESPPGLPSIPVNEISEIVFEGHKTTEEHVMRREMSIEVGDHVEAAQIEQRRQAIQNLGLFRAVKARQESTPEGVRLVITVREKWFWLVYPRLSANSDGQNSVGAEVRWNNVWGRNHSFRTLVSSARGLGDHLCLGHQRRL